MTVPNRVVPLKNSTLLMVPSASLALAVRVTDAGAVKEVVASGEVRLTEGAVLMRAAVISLIKTAEVYGLSVIEPVYLVFFASK